MPDTTPEANREMERVCSVLESVARSFDEHSEEARAIKKAADAYIYLKLHSNLRRSYDAFRQLGLKGLTDDQKQNLRDMGIDPEDD